ncbi:hypothetical protein NIES4102_18830 [Chondrocystis sp. NIES-4102]|nr:hypothetical protein NIES4102_18830 [Chondrocystis sp. NIES-4102]
MALAKIADLYPDYKDDIFGGEDIKNFSVYDYSNDKVGSVYDILVDETGRFRYLVIDTGFWIFGKKVLLPAGKASVDYSQQRVYAQGLTKEQAENLPEYDSSMTVDYDYEERVRKVYRGVETVPGDASYTQDVNTVDTGVAATPAVANVDTNYSYDRDADLYGYKEDDGDNQTLKLYEERLVANKERFRAGAVSIGKRVETETANVSVPVEKEKIVIERRTPTDATAVAPGETAFNEGEVARLEVYEETANIQKEAFVREEVSVRKEVEQDVVSARETIRREELDIDSEGDNIINRDV